jgi:hypothetical protein
MGTKTDFETLKETLRQVKLGKSQFWLAEGDLLLDEKALERYAHGGQANAPPAPKESPHELVATTTAGGRIIRWRPGTVLTYAIVARDFGDQYEEVAANLKQATHDWEVTCGVRFEHRRDQDRAAEPSGVLFTVRRVDTGGELIAAAFFPGDPVERRLLIIDPSYFTTTFDQVGVLRHELGHVLGFRHEHIRPEAPAICPKESLDRTFDLSMYDPRSVMHYFCGGMGTVKLQISENDVQAAQRLYGPPLDQVELV